MPAVVAGEGIEYKVEFTRAGWTNTAGLARPTLQRVAYRLDQDGLWRDYWPVLDRTQASEPVRIKLLGGVRAVTFRFMDAIQNGSSAGRSPAATRAAARAARSHRSHARSRGLGHAARVVEVAG